MKKTFFLLTCLASASIVLQAQPIFLTLTSQGQGSGNGTISKYDAATNTISAIYTFGSQGFSPVGNLFKYSDGKYYGMTTRGGTFGYGVIFSFDVTTSNYSVLHNFDNTNGAEPAGSLIQASNGKLYGVTSRGGASNNGVLFSFDPLTFIYNVLKHFDYNGSVPIGSVIQASDGKLYGMTWSGGTSAAGTIYCFDLSSSGFSIIKNFANNDGAHPHGSLIQASSGKLYGMTFEGGNTYNEQFYIDPITHIPTYIITPGDGVIFSFDLASSVYSVVYNFNMASGSGASPNSSLLPASDGKLYGTTSRGSGGYGGVFSFDPIASNYIVLKKFDSYIEGAIPFGSLIKGSDGNLYGTFSEGGTYYYGGVFSINPVSKTFNKQDFNGLNGSRDFADLLEIKTVHLNCVKDTTVNANAGLCTAFVNNIDPKITPTGSAVTYMLSGATAGSGNGTASGLQLNIGTTTVTYTSTDDPSKVCSFNVTVNATTLFYRDADTDGYGNRADKVNACIQPTGYVADSTDCNDGDASIHSPITYYKDADSDGFGDASSSSTLCQLVPPSGYVTNNTDCDDTQKLYQDTDGDGYGSTIIVACEGVTNNTDCDDNNAAIHAPVTFYQDADNDGYGNSSNTISVCSVTPPGGYIANNLDCNDTKASIHPGATEICNNGIDDDCDGQVDEGCAVGIPSISINDLSVYESSGAAILTVSLSNASTTDIIIAYSTADGTATSSVPKGKKGVIADFKASSGNITIPAGNLSATVPIIVNADNVTESPENFTVRLGLNKVNAKKATIADGTALVTILDGTEMVLSSNKRDISTFNQEFRINALPNPSATYFTLITGSNTNKPISIIAYDQLGRTIETRYNLRSNYTITIGHNYKPGLYYLEITQGNQKQTLKLIKSVQ